MTVQMIVYLICDECDEAQDGVYETRDAAFAAADAAGWFTGPSPKFDREICPNCVEF